MNINANAKNTIKIMFVKFGKIEQIVIIIIPATKFPSITVIHVSIKLKLSSTAIAVPVHTPVKGSGIATNKNTPNIFIKYCLLNFLGFSSLTFSKFLFASASILVDFFFIIFSIDVAKFLNNLVFFNQFIIGKNNNAKKGTTKQLPKKLKLNDFQEESATSPHKDLSIPKGIPPRSSIIGIIEINMVANHTLVPNIFLNISCIASAIPHLYSTTTLVPIFPLNTASTNIKYISLLLDKYFILFT